METVRSEYFARHGDSSREIVSIPLERGARLHRFRNKHGCPLSAIYRQGEEVWCCRRDKEADMIEDWNAWGAFD